MATPKKPKSQHKKPGRKPRPKNQQATSAAAILRAKQKAIAIACRKQGFSIAATTDAINENFGPEGDEPWPNYRKISGHKTTILLKEAILEAVDPLEKKELLTVTIAQHNDLLATFMPDAMRGSLAHGQMCLQILERLARTTGINEKDDNSGANNGNIVHVVINGKFAEI